MTGRLIAIGIALCLSPLSIASADEISDEEIDIPPKQAEPPPPPVAPEPEPQPVSAPMPASVSVSSTSVGAGLGVTWGRGTLHLDGDNYAFKMKGIGVGDLGYATIEAFGSVSNIEEASQISGTYVAVEVGAATGPGVGAVTMRNVNGVVITLQSDRQGAQLSLGADALQIELE